MNSILQVRDSATGEWINIPALVGPKGEVGQSGVYFGKEEPTDENVNVWIKETDNSGNTLNFISYTPQELTPEQQAQARQNIGIDELPTGGGSNYRLIYKIVFDETNQTKIIKITQDMDGNPLELTQLFIYADWGAHESSRADAQLGLNNTTFPWIFCVEKTPYKYTVHAEAFEGVCYFNFDAKITDGKGTSRATYFKDITGSKINEIVWRTLGVNPPPGSTFAVYGY